MKQIRWKHFWLCKNASFGKRAISTTLSYQICCLNIWIWEKKKRNNTHTHTHMSWAFANKTLDHMCWRQTNNSRRCNKGSTIAQIRQHRLVYALVFLVCNSDNSRVKIMNTTVDLRNRPSTEPSFSCTKPKFGENLNVLMKMQYLTYQFSWSKKKSQFS